MTAAANELFISQSALSIAIKNFEQECGMPLFYKQGRYLYLTEAGKLVYNTGTGILNNIDQLLRYLKDMRESSTHTIKVSADSPEIIYDARFAFNRYYENVKIDIDILGTNKGDYVYNSDGADLYLLGQAINDPMIDSVLVITEPMLLCFHESSPLLSAETILPKMIENQVFILPRTGHRFRELFDSILSQMGISPQQIIEVDTPEHVYQTIMTFESGISFIPQSSVNTRSGSSIATRMLDCPFSMRSVYIGCPINSFVDPYTQEFLEFLLWFCAYTNDNHKMPNLTESMTYFETVHNKNLL